jgi:hypothetical protein
MPQYHPPYPSYIIDGLRSDAVAEHTAVGSARRCRYDYESVICPARAARAEPFREFQKISFPVPITTSNPIRKMITMIHSSTFIAGSVGQSRGGAIRTPDGR